MAVDAQSAQVVRGAKVVVNPTVQDALLKNAQRFNALLNAQKEQAHISYEEQVRNLDTVMQLRQELRNKETDAVLITRLYSRHVTRLTAEKLKTASKEADTWKTQTAELKSQLLAKQSAMSELTKEVSDLKAKLQAQVCRST